MYGKEDLSNEIQDRKIRFLCRPKLNTPVGTEYNNETLPRSSRIALVPPTPILLFVLSREDKEFIQSEFCDCLRVLSAPIRMKNAHRRRIYKLWLKVEQELVTIDTNILTNIGIEDYSRGKGDSCNSKSGLQSRHPM